MSHHHLLTTTEIQEAFATEIQAAAGTVLDAFNDGQRLFLRSVLPRVEELRPRDNAQGGVALRASETEVWVHPYVFRVVCRNGAIWAHALESRHLRMEDFSTPEDEIEAIRETVQACCAEEVFARRVLEMRALRSVDGTDAMLNMMAMLSSHLPPRARNQAMQSILGQFASEGDRSAFGLMNAVTATARDTADPEVRWRLEELGGGIAALRRPQMPPDTEAREFLEEEALVLAGHSSSGRGRMAAS
jgi:hypothetical protein